MTLSLPPSLSLPSSLPPPSLPPLPPSHLSSLSLSPFPPLPPSFSSAGFPLASLNLMDYCYVTDVGVACLTGMNTLMELSLGRTKLTDNGMVFLQGVCVHAPLHACVCVHKRVCPCVHRFD